MNCDQLEVLVVGGSRDRSGSYGFTPKLDVYDPIDEVIAEIIRSCKIRR